MNVDKALAKFSIFSKMLDGGDTGRRRAEHRSSFQFTQHIRTRLSSIFDSFDIRLMFFNLESFEKKMINLSRRKRVTIS